MITGTVAGGGGGGGGGEEAVITCVAIVSFSLFPLAKRDAQGKKHSKGSGPRPSHRS